MICWIAARSLIARSSRAHRSLLFRRPPDRATPPLPRRFAHSLLLRVGELDGDGLQQAPQLEGTVDKEPPAHGDSVAAKVTPTPKYNRRGNKIPNASPEDLLTGDRTGDDHAKVLVSPQSYGRTERALRQRTST